MWIQLVWVVALGLSHTQKMKASKIERRRLDDGLAHDEDEEGCTNSCPFAGDGECDDGGPDSNWDICICGSDCIDCGYRHTCHATNVCSNTCFWAADGECDDGEGGADFDFCGCGSDCLDCGVRAVCSAPTRSPTSAPTPAPGLTLGTSSSSKKKSGINVVVIVVALVVVVVVVVCLVVVVLCCRTVRRDQEDVELTNIPSHPKDNTTISNHI